MDFGTCLEHRQEKSIECPICVIEERDQLRAEVERLREALTRINVLADPYRESEAWASPEAYSRWAAQIASEALNG